jgi:hypothetical protein
MECSGDIEQNGYFLLPQEGELRGDNVARDN